jgi:hypothetical protein
MDEVDVEIERLEKKMAELKWIFERKCPLCGSPLTPTPLGG